MLSWPEDRARRPCRCSDSRPPSCTSALPATVASDPLDAAALGLGLGLAIDHLPSSPRRRCRWSPAVLSPGWMRRKRSNSSAIGERVVDAGHVGARRPRRPTSRMPAATGSVTQREHDGRSCRPWRRAPSPARSGVVHGVRTSTRVGQELLGDVPRVADVALRVLVEEREVLAVHEPGLLEPVQEAPAGLVQRRMVRRSGSSATLYARPGWGARRAARSGPGRTASRQQRGRQRARGA